MGSIVPSDTLTSMARTHMQSDLAASDTLPMTSGWKSDSVQNWLILFSTRAEMLFLSKLISVLIKLESPAGNNWKIDYKVRN